MTQVQRYQNDVETILAYQYVEFLARKKFQSNVLQNCFSTRCATGQRRLYLEYFMSN